ncbi:hypothetical protein BD410DRAFT_785052 [Rickenella mellea]|uniref:DUF6533 domain-containing protein n=1 Tax=Rickenella mellea TaxID=50990 RepID=A0A4Y7QC91_9AGAM|nr:hypothetical protein BD410DRAFT_785052 [Rickenella mellea]
MSSFLHAIVESFYHLFVIKCTTIAAVTVVTWDYFLTLQGEVDLIWRSRWNLSKFLFVLNRYLAFVDPLMLVYVLFFADDDPRACEVTFRTLGYIATVGFIIGQCILILRAFAVWGSHLNKFFACLFSLFFCTFGLAIWVNSIYFSGITSTGNPVRGMKGCAFVFANRLEWVDLFLVAFVEFISTILLMVKAFQHFRLTRRSLMTTIYNDGLLYFSCILATTIANLFVVFTAPAQLNNFLIVVQRVLHSVLCNRVVLHIREAYHAQTDVLLDGFTLSVMEAAPMEVVHMEKRSFSFSLVSSEEAC